MTPAEETNERNACDEWFHEQEQGASIQDAWLERARRAEAEKLRLTERIVELELSILQRMPPVIQADAEWSLDKPSDDGFYWIQRLSYKGERMSPEVVQRLNGRFLFPGDDKAFEPTSTVFAFAYWSKTHDKTPYLQR